jgi:hypothetical protein
MGCKRHSCTCSHCEYSLDSRESQNVKVPSSPYKRGTRARVKGFTNFEVTTGFWRFYVSPSFVTCVLLFATLVFGDSFRFSNPQHWPVAHGYEAKHSRRQRSCGVAARPLAVLLPPPLRRYSTSWPPSVAPVFCVSRPRHRSPEQSRSRGHRPRHRPRHRHRSIWRFLRTVWA